MKNEAAATIVVKLDAPFYDYRRNGTRNSSEFRLRGFPSQALFYLIRASCNLGPQAVHLQVPSGSAASASSDSEPPLAMTLALIRAGPGPGALGLTRSPGRRPPGPLTPVHSSRTFRSKARLLVILCPTCLRMTRSILATVPALRVHWQFYYDVPVLIDRRLTV
jgi:hypothetical protein